jgi:hypothetical protein
MTRGINKTIDRKLVKSKSVQIRLSEYDLESIQLKIKESDYNKGVSAFIRELVLDHTKPKKVL